VSDVDPDASRRCQAVLPTDSIDRVEQIAGDLQREALELIQADA
jgi:hypothetical protein